MSHIATSTLVTPEQKAQFERDGFFILERVMSERQLQDLRDEAQRFVDWLDAEMERQGATSFGISHYKNRYFIGGKYRESRKLRDFLFSDLMADVCRSTLGEEAYLFNEQYVIKAAEKGMHFGWHQDSGYIGHDHKPYLSCWCALDDMSEENGTVYMLPYDKAGTRDWVRHSQEEGTNDLIGYRGDDPGIPVIAPAGSIAVFSSTTFHRSGTNQTDNMRRVYLAQYSCEPIMNADGSKLWGSAVPFLKNGENIYDEAANDWSES
jgi:ectoine hydroxylase-related dioxygenase (phytanoyl-CoA dioxygenase family)